VILTKPDLIDNLGVAVHHSIPVRTFIVALLASVFASFRSRATLQLEILALAINSAFSSGPSNDPN
jgi:hypothetical protein